MMSQFGSNENSQFCYQPGDDAVDRRVKAQNPRKNNLLKRLYFSAITAAQTCLTNYCKIGRSAWLKNRHVRKDRSAVNAKSQPWKPRRKTVNQVPL